MKEKNWADLLPPLPTLNDVFLQAQQEHTNRVNVLGIDSPKPQIVSLTENDFEDALKETAAELPKDLSPANIRFGLDIAVQTETAESSEPEKALDDEPQLSSSDLDCYLTAAALRYTYLLNTLTPITTTGSSLDLYSDLTISKKDAVFAHLTGQSDIVKDAHGNARWLLKDDARRDALKKLLETVNVEAAIEQARADIASEQAAEQAKAEETDDEPSEDSNEAMITVEQILWGYLSSSPLPLETPDRRQLILTQQVVNWLHGLSSRLSVPSPDSIARQLAKETLLQPYRHLTGEWKDGKFESYFMGREGELKQLYNYLDILPPKSLREKFDRIFSRFTSTAWSYLHGKIGHRPLLIHGPGGVGKSTLLAQFLLDHLTRNSAEDRFPYVYLDFDLSALNVREPLTLLAEAARQLAVEYPESQAAWEAAREEWLQTIASTNPDQHTSLLSEKRAEALTKFVNLIEQSETEGVKVSQHFERGLPFLLVLDTFEEVQYHNRDDVKDVFRFLNAMSERLRALRVVLMGRAPLEDLAQEFQLIESGDADALLESDHFGTGAATDFGVIEVPLGDLETSIAEEYLSKQGISDPELAQDLVQALGANPLSLRLISRVLRKEKIDLSEMRKEVKWKPGVSDRFFGRTVPPKELLQGVLFRRILGHIHNDKIRDLAHPGLILRRITPDLIQKVLAEPCGLGPLTEQQAEDYFNALEKEVSLVGTDRAAGFNEKVLKHRPELRRIMLRLMDADNSKQEQIQQVHENAIEYYASKTDPIAREEELYHRLMIGDFPRPEKFLDDIPTEEAVAAGYVASPSATTDPRPQWRQLLMASEELPVKANAYLEARLQRELSTDKPIDWTTVDQLDWELMLLGRASRRARERSHVLSALESLSHDIKEVESVHGELSRLSPLPMIKIALLVRARRFSDALKQARNLRKTLGSDDSWRRNIACSLLAAQAAAHSDDANATTEFLLEAKKKKQEAATSMAPDSPEFQQTQRQCLRITVECCLLTPKIPLLQSLTDCLAQIAERTTLDSFAVLTRYAVSAAFACELPKLPDDLTAKILQIARQPRILSLLFTDLPKTKTNVVAEALATWTQEVMRKKVDPNVFKFGRPPQPSQTVAVQNYWRKLLLERPADVAKHVPQIVKAATISDARLTEIITALTPEPRAQGEDAVDEARRRGDLLPGEGPLIDRTSNLKKSKK